MPGRQTHASLYDKSSILEPCTYALSASVPKQRAVTWEPRPIRAWRRKKRSAAGAVLAMCACCMPSANLPSTYQIKRALIECRSAFAGFVTKKFRYAIMCIKQQYRYCCSYCCCKSQYSPQKVRLLLGGARNHELATLRPGPIPRLAPNRLFR